MSKLNNKYDDLPYEKCLRYGPGALSNSELLAVIIRTGTKRHNCLEVANQVLKASGAFSKAYESVIEVGSGVVTSNTSGLATANSNTL